MGNACSALDSKGQDKYHDLGTTVQACRCLTISDGIHRNTEKEHTCGHNVVVFPEPVWVARSDPPLGNERNGENRQN